MQTIDLRGQKCPFPVLRAKKALAALGPGERVALETDDPHAPADFEVFARQSGHRVVGSDVLPDGAMRTVLERRSE